MGSPRLRIPGIFAPEIPRERRAHEPQVPAGRPCLPEQGGDRSRSGRVRNAGSRRGE